MTEFTTLFSGERVSLTGAEPVHDATIKVVQNGFLITTNSVAEFVALDIDDAFKLLRRMVWVRPADFYSRQWQTAADDSEKDSGANGE